MANDSMMKHLGEDDHTIRADKETGFRCSCGRSFGASDTEVWEFVAHVKEHQADVCAEHSEIEAWPEEAQQRVYSILSSYMEKRLENDHQ
jgi:acetone carboxylase gamma subunit